MFRYVSIDIETLGLNPETCDIIEFGAVIEDMSVKDLTKLSQFHCYILPESREVNWKQIETYQGEPYAMAMHSDKLKRIATRERPYTYLRPDKVGEEFSVWLGENGYEGWQMELDIDTGMVVQPTEIFVAGKNFSGFDMRFLRRLPTFENFLKIHHRITDPGSMYTSPQDVEPPSLEVCLARAGIYKNVDHTAIGDALDVIKCIRKKWNIEFDQ